MSYFLVESTVRVYNFFMATPTTPAATHYLNSGWREVSFTVSGSRVTVQHPGQDAADYPAAMARTEYARLVEEGYTAGRIACRAA